MGKAFRKLSFIAIKRAQRKLKNRVPKLIGEHARRFFANSFTKEGFTDLTLDKWDRREKETRRSSGKKILSDRGFLKNSIRRTRATPKKIMVSSVGLRYARIHNDGGGKLPKRQFMGDSRRLNKEIKRLIERELKKATK